MENENVIREDNNKTHSLLSQKLENLEEQVMSSVEKSKAAVSATVSTVNDTVHQGVEAVKDAIDVRSHVDQNPWMMVSGSVALGFVLGSLFPTMKGSKIQHSGYSISEEFQSTGQGCVEGSTDDPSVLHALEPAFITLRGLALGAMVSTVREVIGDKLPPSIGEHVMEILDSVTNKLSAKPSLGNTNRSRSVSGP